ncbi:C4-dicarboxylate ABC transporter substrate-binding protein [Planomonospora parontospora subsp. parontospora]|uniref:C4-dicarboxylate ABC transporter substrate-binding protein n=2 Tax=Planomonospora parontospora TaxID=58119 RepID=A0AA37BCR1_9ACTN|nr:tripartite tricarboxylate transporter substrate binding protein [Planomonospora parontospora]GGK50768.1 C4-dicarboxylate ABC transporter substrate-binding protein [Planomonospora parontospora]GII07082.1 C4-dicarboxylate ABC transporter substrate-binding protein [Planomonospora parontospora subsp. parontospora]
MRLRRLAVLAILPLAALTACGSGSATGTSALRIMAPASPGGGWDQTARTAEQALKSLDPSRKIEVYNVPGAGGTIGLSQLEREKGNGDLLMTMGLVMVGAVEQNKSQVTLADTTPVAKLVEEYELVVVPAESPHRTLADLVAAWKADPAKIAVAGGSAGGTDHIVAGLMAKAAGIDPKRVNYVAHSGGGEALNALLGNKVAMGVSGVGEFAEHVKSGRLRALGVSAPARIASVDAPTLKEAGLDVELANWRGFVAPRDLDEEAQKKLVDLVTKMHGSQAWKDAVAKNGWTDAFQAGKPFADFLAAEQIRIKAIIAEMGLVS